MVQRAGIFSLICVIFCVVIISIEAGKWTIWRSITRCDAKPCKCPGDSEKKPCTDGIWYQLRGCIVDNDGKACQYDKQGGPIRTHPCKNEGVCPGWSNYTNESKCEESGNIIETRYCNNPPPIHKDINCVNSAGEEALSEEKVSNCEYVAPPTVTTTAASTVSTTKLPCCNTTEEATTEGPAEETTEASYDYANLWCDSTCGGDYDYGDNETSSEV